MLTGMLIIEMVRHRASSARKLPEEAGAHVHPTLAHWSAVSRYVMDLVEMDWTGLNWFMGVDQQAVLYTWQ